MCAHISAPFVAIGEGGTSHHRTTYTLKELAQQACNRLLHHQTMSAGDTKPPQMSGGRPLPLSAPQTVGVIDVQLCQTSCSRPLSVSVHQTVGVEVQLCETNSGCPLSISAPQLMV